MDYRNALGTFTFDDNVQESHMKLIVQNVTGQYLNPKKGEPELTDEESCYEFIRERCGNVLAGVGFELDINVNQRVWTEEQFRLQKIKDFDARVALYAKEEQTRGEVADLEELNRLLDQEDERVRASFGGWLVGPAAVR